MGRIGKVFVGAVLLGAAAVLVAAAVVRYRAGAAAAPPLHRLAADVWVTAQVTPAQLPAIRARGFAGLVDLRPDGEVVGQPSSAAIGGEADAVGMQFRYAPVPHGEIPAKVVEELGRALAGSPRPVLLYCHSGRRAARTWALAEASRAGGLGAAAIEAAVRGAGQSADDLDAEIVRRIAARPAVGRGA
ncbi:MAG TPA: sulfur transferase domain-containing protein [Dyella sp.]|nr:sulfur transferase domain-containing protein [Dyella sp.]